MEWTDERGLWELLILEGVAPIGRMSCVAAGDVDGDGNVEILAGGDGLLWYRPETRERGVIVPPGSTYIHGGLKLEDLDGDGLLEAVMGESPTEADAQSGGKSSLVWYKPGRDLREPWERFVIEPDFPGYSHDLMLADLDGSGDRKIVTVSVYAAVLGIYVYQRSADVRQPWAGNAVSRGIFADGTCVGDVDGDGVMEIVCGPDLYKAPERGVMAGPWARSVYAPDYRDMCLTALVDITKNGRPDIVAVEAEYMNGRLCWFENRTLEDPEHPWIEHFLQDGMIFAHSLFVRRNTQTEASFVVGEMEKGGWLAPQNHDARVAEFYTQDGGESWMQRLICKGEGTHQAIQFDVDGDGEAEIIGESNGYHLRNPRLQIWKRRGEQARMKPNHRFVDRDKPGAGTFLLTGDLDGDGADDVVSGKWWYRYPGYERREIPGISQVLCLYDVDRDGKLECVAERQEGGRLSLCWLKPSDALRGIWQAHEIGGTQAPAAGATAARLLPGSRAALAISYQMEGKAGCQFPELFEIAPEEGPWKRSTLAEIPWSGQLEACDIDGDGNLDVVAGGWWLKNLGNGEFKPVRIAPEGFEAAGVATLDVNGDGRPDVVLGERKLDAEKRFTPWSRVLWLENPADPEHMPWAAHGIDSLRCVHSIGAGDLDGDGQPEIVCGEHDPFWPYRNRCRLIVYRKADANGLSWTKQPIDERFEHFNGAKVTTLPSGALGIFSHGKSDTKFLSLWEFEKDQ